MIEALEDRRLMAIDVSLGNLIIPGSGGLSFDSITIARNEANLRVTDLNNAIVAGDGVTQVNSNTVEVPFDNITGRIFVDTLGGNDVLTVDFASGNPIPVGGIDFTGAGISSAGDDDQLRLTGYSLTNADGVSDVSLLHSGPEAGSVILAGLGTVRFTGIETLTLAGTAADLEITVPSDAESVTLADDGAVQDPNGNTPGTSALFDATIPYSFEFTEFSNPTNSLKLLRGSFANDLLIGDLVTSGLNASLTVGTGSSRFDQITLAGATMQSSGNTLALLGNKITAAGPITTNGGAVTLDADNGITITKPILTNGGAQNLEADANADDIGSLLLEFSIAQFLDPNPAPGNSFGSTVTILTSGNVVVTSPFDDFGGTDAGAVYLFNGFSGALISTLRGSSANDNVGRSGVTVLSNGNYVVGSTTWNGSRGAVTWGSGMSGVSGVVSASNSLVGSSTSDRVGTSVTALNNGNYVVRSSLWDNGAIMDAGAATWGSGTTGVSGVVSASNSLVGSMASDSVGNAAATALSNGNYVIRSSLWDNGAIVDAGAVTWGNGTMGVRGVVSASNSLVGSTASDRVGEGGVTALSNGNYVVGSPSWNGSRGAFTWGSGASGASGVVSASNSLVGSTANDSVGSSVTALTNSNYVVSNSNWNGSRGAVTWGSGLSSLSGVVSASNSLVGSTVSDRVGDGGVTALSNGNYVVRSSSWDNGAIMDVGAVTWGNGMSGVSGAVSVTNSLVGSVASDSVGSGVTALSNGNYVVRSSGWDKGAIVNAGAVTWGNGMSGVSGAVSVANSLVGSLANDLVGSGVTALSNGNYVVLSSSWDNGATTNVGAITWGNGISGVSGAVSASNSLVGSRASDNVGNGGVTALSNGNYVVASTSWDNGAIVNAGAVTWVNGATSVSGVVSATNSLVGSSASDAVGDRGVSALSNGNYVVGSSNWNASRGAFTWGSGASGVSGAVSASNSLVGSTAGDSASSVVTALSNGNYVIRSPRWDNNAIVDAGAITWGSGTSGVTGVLPATNSIVGNMTGAGSLSSFLPATFTESLIVTFPTDDINRRVIVGSQSFGFGASGTLSAGGGSMTLQAGDALVLNGEVSTPGGNIVLDAGRVQPIRSGVDVVANQVAFSEGSNLAIHIGGAMLDTQYGQFNVSGAVNLSGTNLVLTHSFPGILGNEVFTIVNASGGVTGQFHGLAIGASVTIGSIPYVIQYNPTSVQLVPNLVPTDIGLSSTTVAENQPVNTLVGDLSTTDPNSGGTFSYALVTGEGSTDNASFQIVGSQLRTNAVFDFEAKNSYSIRVRTTDQGQLSFERAFTIVVNNSVPTVGFVASTSSDSEATSTVNLVVALSAASNQTVTVTYGVTGGTATGGGIDYFSPSGILTFAPGETTKVISLQVVEDSSVELDETIQIALLTPTDASLDPQNIYSYTVLDNDLPSISFAKSAVNDSENIASVAIDVVLSAVSHNAISVKYTAVPGTAKESSDFIATSGLITFGPGELVKTLVIPIVNDNAHENTEIFRVNLANPVDAQMGALTSIPVGILDDDAAERIEWTVDAILNSDFTAYNFLTSGSLSLGYLNNGYYADINLPGGGKLDTGAFQNWIASGAGKLTGADVPSATLPSVNPVQLLMAAVTGGQVNARLTSDYYDQRDDFRASFDTPVYYSSERLTEWLSLEAQTSAIVTSVFVNPSQWLNELKRQGILEWGRFDSWIKVHNLSLQDLLADTLNEAVSENFAVEMAGLFSQPIIPRGLELSDGHWLDRNNKLVQDPFGLFSDEYLRALVGLHPQGENTVALRDAMWELFQNPTSADDELLARIAQLRERPVDDIRSEYQLFLAALSQANETVVNVASKHRDFVGSNAQLRFGKIVGDAFGIDPVFGSALNPTGGLVGSDNDSWDSSSRILSFHGAAHDAAGYLYNYQDAGPGYKYLGVNEFSDLLGVPEIPTSNPLAGQRSGITYWAQVFRNGFPLRVMLNPSGPVNYEYTHTSSPILGAQEVGSWDLSHASFGLTYTGRDTVPGINDPYRAVLEREGFNLETLALPIEIARKSTFGGLGGFAFEQSLFRDGIAKAFNAIGKADWEGAIDWNELKANGISSFVDGTVFGSLARTFLLTNDNIRSLLPSANIPAPAVVSLIGTPVENNVREFLDKLSLGNKGRAAVTRLEFDISTYELIVEFDLRHRHEWGNLVELAKDLFNSMDAFDTSRLDDIAAVVYGKSKNLSEAAYALWQQLPKNPGQIADSIQQLAAALWARLAKTTPTEIADSLKNLASALYNSTDGAGKDLSKLVDSLWKAKPDLAGITKATWAQLAKTTPTEIADSLKNLASALYSSTEGAGKDLSKLVEALWKAKPDLVGISKATWAQLAKTTPTELAGSLTNLATALYNSTEGAGKDLSKFVDALWKTKPDLVGISKATWAQLAKTTPTEIAGSLTNLATAIYNSTEGAGKDLSKLVDSLWKAKPDLVGIAKATWAQLAKTTPTEIAGSLTNLAKALYNNAGTTGKNLGSLVDALWKTKPDLVLIAQSIYRNAGDASKDLGQLAKALYDNANKDLGKLAGALWALKNDLPAVAKALYGNTGNAGKDLGQLAKALYDNANKDLGKLAGALWASKNDLPAVAKALHSNAGNAGKDLGQLVKALYDNASKDLGKLAGALWASKNDLPAISKALYNNAGTAGTDLGRLAKALANASGSFDFGKVDDIARAFRSQSFSWSRIADALWNSGVMAGKNLSDLARVLIDGGAVPSSLVDALKNGVGASPQQIISALQSALSWSYIQAAQFIGYSIPPVPKVGGVIGSVGGKVSSGTKKYFNGITVGATAFFDANKNSILDPNEPWDFTDSQGAFLIDVSLEFDTSGNGILDDDEGQWVVHGGMDPSTGLPAVSGLVAPATSEMITPLTSLVASLSVSHSLTTAEVTSQVLLAMGLPELDLASFDPIAQMLDGNSTGAQVVSAHTRIQDTAAQLAALFAAPNGSPTDEVLTKTVADVIAVRIANSTSAVVFGDASIIESLVRSVESSTGVAIGDELIAGASSVIAATNQRIAALDTTRGFEYLVDIAQIKQISQGAVARELWRASTGDLEVADVVEANTGEALDARIATAVISPVLVAPADIFAEATDANGATVSFTILAKDIAGQPIPTIISHASGSTFALGNTFVTASATDSLGTTVTTTFTITVGDTKPPEFSQLRELFFEATGPDGAAVTLPNLESIDLVDPNPLVTYDNDNTSASFPLGSTMVTATTTDASGNSSSSQFQVTVADTVGPVILFPANVVVEATEPGGALVTLAELGVSDVVDPNPVVYRDYSSGLFPVGTTVISITALDASGNTTTESFTVNVLDTTPPQLSVPPNMIIEADATGGFLAMIAEVSATDLADPNPNITFNIDQLPLGTTLVTAMATDASGNSTFASFAVTVVDTKAPEITSEPVLIFEASEPDGAQITYSNLVFKDLADPNPLVTFDIPAGFFPIGTTVVTATATDVTGNSRNFSIPITVADTVAPVLTGLEDIIVRSNVPGGAQLTIPQAIVSDSGDDAPVVSFNASSGFFPIGTTRITAIASDASGNESQISFAITVVDGDGDASFVPAITRIEGARVEGNVIAISGQAISRTSLELVSGLTFSWDVYKNGTLVTDAGRSGADLTLFSFTPDDNGDFRIVMTVTNQVGIASATETTIHIDNSAPQVSFSYTLEDGQQGSSVQLYALVQDASVVDSLAGFTYVWSISKDGEFFVGETSSTGRFIFSPELDGSYVASLTVTDQDSGLTKVGEVLSVSVPVAGNANLESAEDSPVSGILLATDRDDDLLIYSLVDGPAHGTIVFDPIGLFVYTPDTNYYGEDAFTFQVNDGHRNSNLATVALRVTPVNDAPIAMDLNFYPTEDMPLSGSLPRSDLDGDLLTYSVVESPSNGSIELSSNGSLVYTPHRDYHGRDTFTVQVSDGLENSLATILIAVASVNDVPLTANINAETSEDTQFEGQLSATDLDEDELIYSLVNEPLHGLVTLNPDGSFLYIPTADYFGSDFFTYRASDGLSLSDVSTVSIAVNSVNDAPVAINASGHTDEDTPLSGRLSASDIDRGTLTYFLVDKPTHGLVVVSADGIFLFRPDTNYSGTDSFTFRVDDGNISGHLATFSITTNPVNDTPVANAGQHQTSNEGGQVLFDGIKTSDVDTGDFLSFHWDFGDGVTATGVQTSHIYADNGVYTATLTVTDLSGASSQDSHFVTVVNVAPTPRIVSIGTPRLEGTAIAVSATATDPSFANDTLTFAWSVYKDGSADSFVTAGNNSNFSFIPNDNGTYRIVLTVSDEDGGSTSVESTITVENAAPTAMLQNNNGVIFSDSVGTVTLSSPNDLSALDLSSLRYAFATSLQGLASITYETAGTLPFYELTGLTPGLYSVFAKVIDKDEGFTEYQTLLNVISPQIELSPKRVAENSPSGTLVGNLWVRDSSGLSYKFVLLDNAGGRFALSGTSVVVADGLRLNFEANTAHDITVGIQHISGATTSQSFTIDVTNVLELESFEVQKGAAQRSFIRNVDFVFDNAGDLQSLLAAGRIQLTRASLDGLNPTAVNLSGKLTQNQGQLSIDFGAQGIGGNRNNNVGDGYYQFKLDIDGNGSFETTRSFYRLFGDANGDRQVSDLDVAAINAVMGAIGSNLNQDINGDGVVNALDRLYSMAGRGRRLANGLWIDD